MRNSHASIHGFSTGDIHLLKSELNSTPSTDYKYWAFISYSHQDKSWADWLHRKLETYRIPAALVQEDAASGKTVPRRIFPVFRDREELPTSADLGSQIQEAIKSSRFLVVICSPRSAMASIRRMWTRKSRWIVVRAFRVKKWAIVCW